MRGATGALACVALAACGTSAPARRPPPHATTEDEAHAEPFVVASIDPSSVIVRDDKYLYWIDPTGIHRRPLGGPDAGHSEMLDDETAAWAGFTAIDVHAGTIAVTDGDSVFVLRPGAKKLAMLAKDVKDVVDVAVGEHDVAIAQTGAILRAPLDGGAVTTLATQQFHVAGIDLDDDHVYWIDYGEERQQPPPPRDTTVQGAGAVRRVALSGGKAQTLAGGQRGPAGIVVHGGRVWWCNDRGLGMMSAKLDGSDQQAELSGTGDLLTVDDAGAVAHTPQGAVIEKRTGGAALLRMIPDGTWLPQGVPPVVDDEWVYAIATRSYDGTAAILAVPRTDDAPVVSVPLEGTASKARARDGVLYWLEQKRDGSGIELWRADAAKGSRGRLTDHYGWSSDLAIGSGDDVYVSEDQSIYKVDGEHGGEMKRFATAESYVTSLTVHRDHVFWIDGQALMARKRSSGDSFVVARMGWGYGGGDTGGDIVFDDDYAYLNNFGGNGPGVFRVSEGGKVETLYNGTSTPPGRDLVKIGDELFFWTAGPTTVHRLDLDGEESVIARLGGNGDGYVNDMVTGGGLIYVTASYSAYYELTRVDPGTGEARAVLRWSMGGDAGIITADDTGAYVALDTVGAIIRVPHDAPAVPDWPRVQ